MCDAVLRSGSAELAARSTFNSVVSIRFCIISEGDATNRNGQIFIKAINKALEPGEIRDAFRIFQTDSNIYRLAVCRHSTALYLKPGGTLKRGCNAGLGICRGEFELLREGELSIETELHLAERNIREEFRSFIILFDNLAHLAFNQVIDVQRTGH